MPHPYNNDAIIVVRMRHVASIGESVSLTLVLDKAAGVELYPAEQHAPGIQRIETGCRRCVHPFYTISTSMTPSRIGVTASVQRAQRATHTGSRGRRTLVRVRVRPVRRAAPDRAAGLVAHNGACIHS